MSCRSSFSKLFLKASNVCQKLSCPRERTYIHTYSPHAPLTGCGLLWDRTPVCTCRSSEAHRKLAKQALAESCASAASCQLALALALALAAANSCAVRQSVLAAHGNRSGSATPASVATSSRAQSESATESESEIGILVDAKRAQFVFLLTGHRGNSRANELRALKITVSRINPSASLECRIRIAEPFLGGRRGGNACRASATASAISRIR